VHTGLGGFRGFVKGAADIIAMQYIGSVDDSKLRDDLGFDVTRESEREHGAGWRLLSEAGPRDLQIPDVDALVRYYAKLRVTLDTDSATHPRVGQAQADIIAELVVPRAEAAAFERAVYGEVRTPGTVIAQSDAGTE
jgi:hypothetical protein